MRDEKEYLKITTEKKTEWPVNVFKTGFHEEVNLRFDLHAALKILKVLFRMTSKVNLFWNLILSINARPYFYHSNLRHCRLNILSAIVCWCQVWICMKVKFWKAHCTFQHSLWIVFQRQSGTKKWFIGAPIHFAFKQNISTHLSLKTKNINLLWCTHLGGRWVTNFSS